MTRPTSTDAIKRLAKRVSRERSMPHYQALDHVAKTLGFNNFVHASRSIARGSEYAHYAKILERWWDRDSRKGGVIEIPVQIRTAPEDILKSHQMTGYFGGSRWLDSNELQMYFGNYAGDSEEYAARRARKAARALEFIDITGLKPSIARKCYPKGSWYNRPSIADHDQCWFDPASRTHILTTEPYPDRSEIKLNELKLWEEKHAFKATRINWGSIYGSGTNLWLIASIRSPIDLDALIRKLEAAPTRFPD